MFRLQPNLPEAADPAPPWATRELSVDDPGQAFRLVREIEHVYREGAANGFFKMQSLFYELLHRIVDAKTGEAKQAARIEEVLAYIRAHYSEELSRDKLASLTGVHPDHFSRWFRKMTGRSYVDFVAETRMSKARERLLGSGDSLHEIARKVGYKDEFYFSRKFKQLVGTAPTLYRRKPKTVFSLACNYTAGLLAVGHVPSVGSLTPWLSRRYQAELGQGRLKPIFWDDCHPSGLREEPRPDVILCHDKQYDEEQLELLRELAPTLSIPFGSMSWQEQFMLVAELVGEADRARIRLDRYDAALEIARERVVRKFDLSETVLILEIWTDELAIFGDTYGRAGHIVYRAFGFSPPELVRRQVIPGAGYTYIEEERLIEYDADIVFLIVHNDPTSRKTACRLKRGEAWKALTAVKRGRVYDFDGGLFYGYDPASTEMQLQRIMKAISD
ncbi:helix-turn-helix domain-containing protein [Cohnella cellulosilytica]|uniref:Helix-turn-helix domain-containing protein n=2 Tax=Cohnella cellulosilytica TaxID=986710 RepID=A0ABW2FR51_9BACL